jgi:hypothetical protein
VSDTRPNGVYPGGQQTLIVAIGRRPAFIKTSSGRHNHHSF